MALIDQITKHYASLTNSPRSIEVPEWGVTIYSTPLTLAERQTAQRRANGDEIALAAELVILKARDENGNVLLQRADKPKLMNHADGGVLARIAKQIVGDSSETDLLEEAEKN